MAKPAPRPATAAASAIEIPAATPCLATALRSLPAVDLVVAGIVLSSLWMGSADGAGPAPVGKPAPIRLSGWNLPERLSPA